jgi:hypothetical protein
MKLDSVLIVTQQLINVEEALSINNNNNKRNGRIEEGDSLFLVATVRVDMSRQQYFKIPHYGQIRT